MKKKIILIHAILFVAVFPALSQKKMQFQSVNTFELISGQSPLSTGFQSVNGFKFSSWFAGVGVGVDNYHYKTLPLFFDGRKFFGNEKRAFGYGDVGYDFPIKDKPGKEISYYNSSYHFTGGIYTDLGVGYEFLLNKKNAFSFSLGYSYKKLKCKIKTVQMNPFSGSSTSYTNYELSYGSVVLKTGLVF